MATQKGEQEPTRRRYDPRDSYTVGERIDFGPLGTGTVTDVLSWAAPPAPGRHSLVVTLDDGRLVYFAAGMGEEAETVDMTAMPAMLPAAEAPADVGSGSGPWRAALAQLIGHEAPIPGSRKHLQVKTLSGDGVQVVVGHGPEILLPWRSLEVSRRRLQDYGYLALSDLEALVPDVDASLVAALLMVIPNVVLDGKPPTFYYPDALTRDETASFALSLRPVHLSKSFISIPSDAWPALPLPPLGEHVYIPVIVEDVFTLCRLSHRDAPAEARLYLRDAAGEWLRTHCQEGDTLQVWPLRNTQGDVMALAVEKIEPALVNKT